MQGARGMGGDKTKPRKGGEEGRIILRAVRGERERARERPHHGSFHTVGVFCCVRGRERPSERVLLLQRRRQDLLQHPLDRNILFDPRPHLQDLPGGIHSDTPGGPCQSCPAGEAEETPTHNRSSFPITTATQNVCFAIREQAVREFSGHVWFRKKMFPPLRRSNNIKPLVSI